MVLQLRGWAVGGRWESFHRGFRYADYAAVALLLVLAGAALLHRRRHGDIRVMLVALIKLPTCCAV